MWLLVVLLWCCLSVAASSSSCASCTDRTLVPGANGTNVVLATVRLIDKSGLFADEHQILRRIAYVETRDGLLPGNGGGIWGVNETTFASLRTVNTSSIRAYFGIEWSSLAWSDLRVPLYSGLAARLLIDQHSAGLDLSNASTQAMFWADTYTDSGGNVLKYNTDTAELEDYQNSKVAMVII